jgi:arginine utilization protein RocB
MLVRAAELALEAAPDIEARHVEAALRSLAIRPGDVLVDALSGEWITSRGAVKHRGEEVARALVELARIIKDVEAPE